LFYKAKNASAHRRSVFLVFAAASRLTRLSVRKNTASPSKTETFEINDSQSKYSKAVFTAQKMKAARQAASAAFFLMGLHL